MMEQQITTMPDKCPSCAGQLEVTTLLCTRCGTEVTGRFSSGKLLNLPEPYASVLEMFLRLRGNVKEMERQLGLSYPTVRARLEEAFAAADLDRDADTSQRDQKAAARLEIVQRLGRGEISPAEATQQLRQLKERSQR